jgi:hypothetical protein
MTADVKHNGDGSSDKGTRAGEAESEAVCQNFAPADAELSRRYDPDLALVIAAWATLPTDVRAGIVAMVKAAVKG